MARKQFLAACLTGCVFLPGALHADGPLPTDPTIVAGDIAITNPSATQLLLQQSGGAGIVDWGSFSIGAGYGVDFQNGAGATLNRVTGGDLSQIMGSLTATGSVYLVNQSGIIVGKDGAVNTGGRFVASSLDIANSDFLDGGDNTFAGDSAAYVINLGQISSLGGDVSLMARNVVNAGSVTAPNGTVGLVAGREILMRDASVDDGMFAVRIGGSDSSVSDSGAIRAAAAELRANGGNVYALAGNTDGTITATGVARVKGRVFLTAGDAGKVKVDKTVKATNADGSGGAIAVSGGTVDLAGRLDASGAKGGTVTVNSAIQTTFSGTVLAYGDGTAGSGGFAEISGRHLSFGGVVDTGGGTVLIDPDNIEITTGSAILLGASTLTPDSIVTLLATQDLIIETTGTDGLAGVILVSNDVSYRSTHSLTLLAHGDILAYASLVNGSAVSGGDINLVAGWDGSTSTTAFDPTPFDSADLASQTLFGNSSGATYTIIESTPTATGSVFIGDGYGYYGVAVGSRNGATRVYANKLVLTGSSNFYTYLGYAQLGYNISSDNNGVSGAISVRTTGDIDLIAGSEPNTYAQIGHGGVYSSSGVAAARVDAPITVESSGNLSLIANSINSNTYAMIGHGAITGTTANGLRSGDITVTVGGEVSLQSASVSYYDPAWIGHNSNAFNGVKNANILLTAAAFDLDATTSVGSGGLGTLDISMVSSLLQGGNVTVIATDSGLNLINYTFGNCECYNATTSTDFLVQTADDIHLDSSFFFSNLGGGNAILAAGGNFFNDTRGTGFGTMKGRWLVYSARPDQNLDDIGIMDARFIQYGTTYDPADPNSASLPNGNGLVYSVAPIVTVGPATMTYGGTLVPPTVIVTVDGLEVAADAFGFNLSDPRYTAQVTLSGDGFANAGVYNRGLTVDRSDATSARVFGVTTVAGKLTVDRAVISVALADEEKPYDGTGLYTGTVTLTGFVGTDNASLLTAGPDFSYSGGDNGGVNAGSYLVSASGLTESSGNYSFDVTDTATLTIDQVQLFTSITGNPTKTYDGSAVATLTAGDYSLSGFIAGEGGSITQTVGTYASANAVSENSVSATLAATDYAANAGTLLANYILPTSAFGGGTINQATLTATIIGNPTKIYDGSTAATLTAANFALSGFATGEGADVSQTIGSYTSANVADPKSVTATLAAADFTAIGRTLLSNYILPTAATGAGTITQATLASTIIGNPTKTYDSTTTAALTSANFTLTGFVGTESATIDQTAGTYASPNASITNAVTATLAAANFTAGSGTLLSNYLPPTTVSGNGIINQATLTAAIIGNPTKTYDGTTAATLTSANFRLSGFVGAEGATVTQTAGSYASANASATNPVTATLADTDFAANSGTLLANYILPVSVSATGNGIITQAALTVTAAIIGNPTKIYDGTNLATLTAANFTLSGFVTGEGASVTKASGTYASANASATNLVTATLAASDFTANRGTLLSNYVLPTSATGNGIISQARLSAAITGNPSKIYDGSTAATLTAANFLLSGFVGAEGATVTQTAGTYASPDAAATNSVGTTLAAGDFTANSGTLLANYILPVNASGAGDITQATLTAAITGNPTKIYDGTTAATLTAGNFTLGGFVTGEGAGVSQTAGSYASANASATNAVTAALAAGDFAANSGTNLSNYVLPVAATGNGIITRATLAAVISGLPTKTYDGTTLATLTAGDFTLNGFVTGEGASVTQTSGTYATQNATVPNSVTATLAAGDFAANTGTLLANYILPASATGTGTINRAQLSAAIVGNPTKPFDATTIATLTAANFSLSGFATGEGATVTQTVGIYDTAELGSGKTVTATLAPTDLSANVGTLLSNYILPVSASGTGAIASPPPPVTIELTTRGIDAFSTTPLGEPTGPAPGLEVISTETTRQIIDEVNAGVAFCKQLVRQEYMVDCLSDRLQSVADGLSAVGEYSEVRRALEDAAQKLHALALANSGSLPQAVHRSAGRSSSRPLTAVSDAALASVNGQAAAIINSTELVLLRSSENSERRRVAFEQISQVVDSTKVLLRSS